MLDDARARRRGAARQPRARRARALARADRRLLRARRADPHALARADRRRARCGRRSRASSTALDRRARPAAPRRDERRRHGQAGAVQARRRPHASTHTGVKQGNSTGNYEQADRPPARTAASTRRALDRHQPEGARADRPADAEPLARVGSPPPAAWAAMQAALGARARLRGDAAPGALEHAAAPTLRFALRDRRAGGARGALGRARRPGPDRGARRALRRGDRGPAVRAVRRAGALGHDAAHAAVDAHDAVVSRRSPAQTDVDLPCRAPTTSR